MGTAEERIAHYLRKGLHLPKTARFLCNTARIRPHDYTAPGLTAAHAVNPAPTRSDMSITLCNEPALTDELCKLRDWLVKKIAEDRPPRSPSGHILCSASQLVAALNSGDPGRAAKEARAILSRRRYWTWRQEICEQLLALESRANAEAAARRIVDLTRSNWSAHVEGIQRALTAGDYEAVRSYLEIWPSDELPVRCRAALAAKPGSGR